MKRIALALALLLAPSLAWGQCSGVFPNNTVCGNTTGASNTPRATAASSLPLNLIVGGSTITGGTTTRPLYDNAGVLGEYTASGLNTFSGAISALTGDVTATGPNSVAATLATVNANVGTWGSASQIPILTVNGKGLITAASSVGASFRTALSTTTTYYVNSSAVTTGTCGAFTCQPGSDATSNGASIATPYQTIQAAIDYIKASIDFRGPNLVNIQLTCGRNYTAAGAPVAMVNGPWVGAQSPNVTFPARTAVSVTIVGDAADTTCAVLDSSTHNTIEALYGATLGIEGVTITSTGSNAIDAGGFSGIVLGNVTLGATTQSKIFVHHGAVIENYANFNITGDSAQPAINVDYFGALYLSSSTITFTGNITTPQFIHSARNSDATFRGVTITPGAFTLTGARFLAENGGNITTGTSSLTYFPGTTVGLITSGGSYDAFTRLTSPLAIDSSGVAGPTPFGSTQLTARAADASTTVVANETFGNVSGAIFLGRQARGIASAPTASQSGDVLAGFYGMGYGATTFPTGTTNGGMALAACQNFNDTQQCTQLDFYTTANNAAVVTKSASLFNNGAFNALLGFQVNGAATSGNVLRGNGTNFVNAQLATTDLSGLGTGVATALGVNVGTAGSFVVNGGALGSPSSAGTMPAFTLGGTISGGGQAVNNLSTLAATTSLTSPLHIGGSGTTGTTLEHRNTSGNGTTDTQIFTGGNNGATRIATFLGTGKVGVGSAAGAAVPTNTVLAVSANTATVDGAQTGTSTLLHVVSANATIGGMEFDSFGTGVFPFIGLRAARGTAASKTAIQSGDTLGSLTGLGYQTTTGAYNVPVQVLFKATENYTSTTAGSSLILQTTPNTTNTLTTAMTVRPSGGITIGNVATDPGVGGLYVDGATITFNGLTTDNTHTDRNVCQDTTSKSLFFGSGAAGICLGTSSARFKHAIAPLVPGLTEINLLRPVSYRYNKEQGDPNKDLYGFIAEDVVKVMPKLVGFDSRGRPNSVDWAGIVPVLVKAVQELKAANDNLAREVAQLKVANAKTGILRKKK